MIEKFLNALARVGEPGRWVVAGLVCDPVMQRDERLVVIDADLEVPQANAQVDAVIQPGLHVVFDESDNEPDNEPGDERLALSWSKSRDVRRSS
eukprot:1478513-Prymnesium_polylepis.1